MDSRRNQKTRAARGRQRGQNRGNRGRSNQSKFQEDEHAPQISSKSKWVQRAQASAQAEPMEHLEKHDHDGELLQEVPQDNFRKHENDGEFREEVPQDNLHKHDDHVGFRNEVPQDKVQPLKGMMAQARLRATFYPKFENEKSDQEVRLKMIDAVHSRKGVLEVSLKHSGSLFMYSGNHGGAFAKNSFGNLYTAVGVFVLSSSFQEAWGDEASQKQKEFSDHIENFRLCVSMELVTAVLGDHGQRPNEDYVVVTGVTDLKEKPHFYSTPELIRFCRQWRLPTNHLWLFSSRKSATSFFTAYDALCEEGTATTVGCTLDELSDISVPASRSHSEVQGEILEGLVARIVSPESTEMLQKVLAEVPLVDCRDSRKLLLQKGLREICSQHEASEQQQINALLNNIGPEMCSDWSDWTSERSRNSVVNKFLKAAPIDHVTDKLQEMLGILQRRNMRVRYPCHFKGTDGEEEKSCYRMTIHVLDDSAFRKYQTEMRRNPDLWPLYRGFFVDIDLLEAQKSKNSVAVPPDLGIKDLRISENQIDRLANESENLMLKLKFLPYKIRTFLIRNGLSVLFQKGFPAYKKYYLRQMEIWNTSSDKQHQLDKLLTEWAQYITQRRRKVLTNSYLSEAEPFLERFAKRSSQNKSLVGYTSSGDDDKEGFLHGLVEETDVSEPQAHPVAKQTVNSKGILVFFPGIPGCGKSALCKELLNDPGDLSNGRKIHTLMGDLVKGKYWPLLAKQCQQGPTMAVTLADKNAPNMEVWKTVADTCESMSLVGVPVVPDSGGTEDNPFSLEDLGLFLYRVLQRLNHPGNLDKNSPNAGYVVLMFYNLYSGKDRKEFEDILKGDFGYLVKFPVLKANRPPLPSSIHKVLSEGLELFDCHTAKHGKLDSTKGSYSKRWSIWEKQVREVLNENPAYFKEIQVPFEETFQTLKQQLIAIAKGEIPLQTSREGEERSFKSIMYAALTLPTNEVTNILQQLAATNNEVEQFLLGRTITVNSAHITLAHKRSHGIAAVAAFGEACGEVVPVKLQALLFSSKMCALEAQIVENKGAIYSKNEWPHVTVWTAPGTKAKDASFLPQMVMRGQASRVDFVPVVISGVVELI